MSIIRHIRAPTATMPHSPVFCPPPVLSLLSECVRPPPDLLSLPTCWRDAGQCPEVPAGWKFDQGLDVWNTWFNCAPLGNANCCKGSAACPRLMPKRPKTPANTA